MKLKKIVGKKEYSEFLKWSKENHILKSNTNYFTKLVNSFLTIDAEIEDESIEYLLFAIENDKDYSKIKILNLEIRLSKNNDFLKTYLQILEIFKQNNFISFDEGKLISFLYDLKNYREKKEKNFSIEYEIVKKYWDFINELIKQHEFYFNDGIIEINKNTFEAQKGIKI